ncbi:MAG: TetR family transcriptional regulator [Acidimicrobiaceae bacterium]|nr:TetR family transcriptional regulator [Acidimicrobiaceae bacterium]
MDPEHSFDDLHLALARLPAGRHGLPREFVIQNQRMRVMTGMAQVVAERGYQGTSIARVAAAAAVSRRTFFENFESKPDCFRAVYELAVDRIVEAGREAMADANGQRLSAGLEAALRLLERQPELAQICLIESLSAKVGGGGLEAFVQLLRDADGDADSDETALRTVSGGLADAARERIRNGQAAGLAELAPVAAALAARQLRH